MKESFLQMANLNKLLNDAEQIRNKSGNQCLDYLRGQIKACQPGSKEFQKLCQDINKFKALDTYSAITGEVFKINQLNFIKNEAIKLVKTENILKENTDFKKINNKENLDKSKKPNKVIKQTSLEKSKETDKVITKETLDIQISSMSSETQSNKQDLSWCTKKNKKQSKYIFRIMNQ